MTIKTCFLQCGVIECVPNARSREDIGRNTPTNLHDYFRHIYGKEDSIKYQNVRADFLMVILCFNREYC